MTTPAAYTPDLDAYFARTGYTGPRTPTLATLHAIVAAHATSIPFENLDVLLGRGIDLDPAAVERKLVHARRGGYCFEQNSLLLHVLTALGYAVMPLSARVRWQRPRDFTPPRTHLFLRVDLAGEPWFVDVGVGSSSMAGAIRFVTDLEQPTPHEPRRIVHEDGKYFHQTRFEGAWHDVYDFTGELMHPIDRELANWFTSAHPQSHFRNRLVAARALPGGGRVSLLNRELTLRRADGTADKRELTSAADLLAVLAEHFGLHFPADTRFGPPGSPWPVE